MQSLLASEESYILLRIINGGLQTMELFRDRLSHVFSDCFFSRYGFDLTDARQENTLPSSADDVLVAGDSVSQGDSGGDGGSPGDAFNVLDLILKENLDRLKNMRESISSGAIHSSKSSWKKNYSKNVNIIRALCLEYKLGAAFSLWSKMIGKSAIPDILTHNYMVNGLCKAGYLEEAEWVVGQMLQRGPSPTSATFNMLMSGYCCISDMGRALDIFCMMTDHKVKPNIITYIILINALCKKGLAQNVKKLIDRVLADGHEVEKFDLISYNTLLNGFCTISEIDSALDLLDMMTHYGVTPDITTFNILIHALCKKGLVEDARKLLDKLLANADEGEHSDLITLTILLDCYFKSGDMVQALTLWKEISIGCKQKDIVAYNVLIHGCCLARNFDLVYKCFSEMLKIGFLPDVFSYNTLISVLCKEEMTDEACYIYRVMIRMGVYPDLITYEMIIKSLCKNREIVKAHDFLLCCLRDLYVPEPLVWDAIIDGYVKCGNLQEASYIRDLMTIRLG